MAIFPRPVSPKSAASDLRDMFKPDRPHRWTILALSLTMTGVLLWGFVIDSRRPPKEKEIFYIQSWLGERRDSDIIRKQIEDVAKYEVALELKQGEFQRLADGLGIEWREEAMRNKEERAAIIKVIQQRLDERLAAAIEREGGPAAPPAPSKAP